MGTDRCIKCTRRSISCLLKHHQGDQTVAGVRNDLPHALVFDWILLPKAVRFRGLCILDYVLFLHLPGSADMRQYST